MTKLCSTGFQSSVPHLGTLLTSFFIFLSSSPCLKVSSNLKTGQAQVEWSEQSHDLNWEFYRSRQTPEITPGNYFACGLSFAAVLLVKYCYPPRLWGFALAKGWALPRPQWSALQESVWRWWAMITVTSRTQTEFERAHWTSPGCRTRTYRYTMVDTPCYKVCTINTTTNLQITQMAEFLRSFLSNSKKLG